MKTLFIHGYKNISITIENNLKFSTTGLHICRVGVLISKPTMNSSLKDIQRICCTYFLWKVVPQKSTTVSKTTL